MLVFSQSSRLASASTANKSPTVFCVSRITQNDKKAVKPKVNQRCLAMAISQRVRPSLPAVGPNQENAEVWVATAISQMSKYTMGLAGRVAHQCPGVCHKGWHLSCLLHPSDHEGRRERCVGTHRNTDNPNHGELVSSGGEHEDNKSAGSLFRLGR